MLLLREGGNPSEIVRSANTRLAPFQQMRRWLKWADPDFPRTPTQKPILAKIREVVNLYLRRRGELSSPADEPSPSFIAQDLLQKMPFALQSDGKEPLQLSSIERVELISALEDRYQVDLGEADFSNATSVADLEKLVQKAQQGVALDSAGSRAPVFRYSRWPRWRPVRWIRALAFYCLVRPALLLLGWPRVRGRENLRGLKGPVLIVSNHASYIDPGFVLHALPARLRWRTAVAMGGETLTDLRVPPPGTNFFRAILGRIQYPLRNRPVPCVPATRALRLPQKFRIRRRARGPRLERPGFPRRRAHSRWRNRPLPHRNRPPRHPPANPRNPHAPRRPLRPARSQQTLDQPRPHPRNSRRPSRLRRNRNPRKNHPRPRAPR